MVFNLPFNQNREPEISIPEPAAPDAAEVAMLAEFASMWAEADSLWESNQSKPAWQGYVSADYMAVYKSLAALQGRASTFLEWGSGLGIVTIMASRMGFDAWGIESESELVDHSKNFAKTYGPKARFGLGSFIPDEFQWNPAEDDLFRTAIDAASAYGDLDMELRDFDLIYAYPWPDEQGLFKSIVRQFGSSQAILLMYDAREGMIRDQFTDR